MSRCTMNLVRRAQRRGKDVRCVYLDDAGFGDETNEPIAVVCAVLIEADSQWRKIEADVDRIIETLVPQAHRAGFEFHAKDLFSGTKKNRSFGRVLRND